MKIEDNNFTPVPDRPMTNQNSKEPDVDSPRSRLSLIHAH